jgi:DNA replicative helicase MCM subunit Mcm2 (Cdc46/Mcm family)
MAQRDNHKKISNLLGSQGSRLDINLDDLRGFNPDLARYVTQNPIEAISMFEAQLDRAVQDLRDDNTKGMNEKQQAMQSANQTDL